MRCDANISLMPIGAKEFGTRTETKNVNSLKSVEVAVRYEMRRQAAVLRARGGEVIQETRHFQEADGTTSAGRRKETAEDYRYFPEPDLEPRRPERRVGRSGRGTLPELPWIRPRPHPGGLGRLRRGDARPGELRRAWNWSSRPPRQARPPTRRGPGGWRTSSQQANTRGVALAELPITPAQLARVIALVADGTLANKQQARQAVDGVLARRGRAGRGRGQARTRRDA